MNFNDLKVGMKVYIRDDLIVGGCYDKFLFNIEMLKGQNIISDVIKDHNSKFIKIKGNGYNYCHAMIDWKKTAELNGFNDNDVVLNGIKASEAFIDESDHIALIEKQKHKHYFVDVSNIDKLDVYRVLERFNVTCPVLQHVSKKALCAGNRGHKDLREDIQNMIDSLNRKLEMMEEDNG